VLIEIPLTDPSSGGTSQELNIAMISLDLFTVVINCKQLKLYCSNLVKIC